MLLYCCKVNTVTIKVKNFVKFAPEPGEPDALEYLQR